MLSKKQGFCGKTENCFIFGKIHQYKNNNNNQKKSKDDKNNKNNNKKNIDET